MLINKKITLRQINRLKFNIKFNIFYKFRFHKDYLKNNIDNKIFSKKDSRIWFKRNYKKKIIFSINYNNKKIGLIIYNLKNCYYSIIILKQYRNKKAGTAALNKLVNFLRRKKLKLVTMINTNNKNSIYIHKKIAKSYKKINSKFIFFKIL